MYSRQMRVDNKNNGAFFNDVDLSDLRKKSIRGGAISIGNQALKFLLRAGSTVVMARLLTPSDFGLVAMVSSFIGFVTMFRDFGLSIATIQKQSITEDQLTGLFWVNVLLGLIAMTVCFACAPIIGFFYGEPRAQSITIAFGGIAIISSLGAQHSAVLERQMRFGTLAARDLSALLVGVICGIISAFFGLRFWALIIMQAANTISGTIFLWLKSGWRPGFPKRAAGLRKLLEFGGAQTICSMLAFANHNMDNILIGKFLGGAAVGFYSKAQALLNTPLAQILPPVMKVSTPMFSRLIIDPSQFRRATIKLTEILCFGGSILVMVIFSNADWIVLLMLGNQWIETIPVFKLLAIFGLLEPISWLLGTILVASGKPNSMAVWWAVTVVVVLACILAGLPWGIMGVAVGFTLSGIVTRLWLVFFVSKKIGMSGLKLISACAPFVVVACGVSILMTFLRTVWEPQNELIGIVSFALFGTGIYILALFCIPKTREFLRNLGQMGILAFHSLKGS